MAKICPSIWFTAINGFPKTHAAVLAAATPTKRAPTSPGPCVTATASISSQPARASSSASIATGRTSSIWCRDAISGTTPPNFLCIGTCVEITLDKIFRPSSITAQEVSSQLVSNAKIFILSPYTFRDIIYPFSRGSS